MFMNENIYRHLIGRYDAVSKNGKNVMHQNLVTDHVQALGLLKAVVERIENNRNPEKLIDSIKDFIEKREDGEYQATKVNLFPRE